MTAGSRVTRLARNLDRRSSLAFAPYEVAVSRLHNEARFVVAPVAGRPQVVDGSWYVVPLATGLDAAAVWALLNPSIAR